MKTEKKTELTYNNYKKVVDGYLRQKEALRLNRLVTINSNTRECYE